MDADPKIILKQFETILAAKKNVAHLVSAQGTYPEGNVAVPENGSGTNEVSTFSKKNT